MYYLKKISFIIKEILFYFHCWLDELEIWTSILRVFLKQDNKAVFLESHLAPIAWWYSKGVYLF